MATRIMVINDTQEILDMFRAILEDEGYEVILYSFAILDMTEYERVKPDLIILDLVFGSEKSGWQMLQKLKMNRTTATIPIILCTAATNAVREMEGYLLSKGVGVLLKPFDIDDLAAAVKLALQSRHNIASLMSDSTNTEELNS
jgi:DNA-binding response OmpR family regulator